MESFFVFVLFFCFSILLNNEKKKIIIIIIIKIKKGRVLTIDFVLLSTENRCKITGCSESEFV